MRDSMMQPTKRLLHQSFGQLARCYASLPKVGYLGVPFGKGQKEEGLKRKGLEAAPDALRTSGLINDLKFSGIDVKDYGNVSYQPFGDSVTVENMTHYAHIAANNQQVSDKVHGIIKDGRTCLSVGGDHSIFTGTLHGHLRAAGSDDVAVVYIDAHADMNLNTTSPTGNVHGMSVAMAARELQDRWKVCPHGLEPPLSIPLGSIGYIGLRALDRPERAVIDKHGVAAYTMDDVVDLGIADVLRQLLRRIDPDNRKSIHLSIDTDSMDPSEAPCTTVPERGGLLLREVVYIAGILRRTQRVRALDWVELNPLLGTEEEQKKTINAARVAILSCFAEIN